MDRLAVIDDEARRFAEVLADADPRARVPTCPDWNAADLLWHLTEVHLFWAGILAGRIRDEEALATIESAKPDRPKTIAETLPLREQATRQLLEQLSELDDAEPRWSWWPPDQTVGFTRRMQTYEATMHRVDAELTAGRPISPISDEVAAGAIDHCVDVMWGWLEPWASYEPQAVIEFVADGSGQRWLVEVGHWSGTEPESGKVWDFPRAVRASDGEPTAKVTAPVVDLALWAWTRGGSVDISGDEPARAALDALMESGIQ
ncbi:maleylpyruvate isomerase family mycothiol-dependent enzyme [Microlunatus elymi]|uniref:Maleylpyruvate isomerase family mycothiol-dependent enzyme n=1 Tax=Microlunatus elymi TaxID=2596828 RepID=A0A516PYE8_9ACTN|nr:maleylpyruvate isomerase family mycothiol-dependent enzyme [Microlunatus elymi]QDP96194.1 maleylpyruvate isomerase family mycothiol-dependent enzyme [Microlunatus elymi]